MSETPKSLFPPSSESALTTAKALRRALSPDEKADLEDALRYVRGEVQVLSDGRVDEPDKPDKPDKTDEPEASRSDVWFDWDDWG